MRDALILVIGTGPAGLAAAVALAERGATVQAVGPRPLASAARDTRTAALFGPSVTFMRSIGAFDRLEGASEPITGIRLIDDTGRLLRAPDALFKARDVGRQAFGLNCPNAAIVEALVSRAGTLPTLSLINDSVSAIEPRAEHVAVILASGRTLEARLVVGADGRGSPSRIAAGISATTWSHPQTAIVTSFAHSRPHGGISTEFHRASGPFTTVPLKGDRSSLVWVE
ncbi:MAG TPA: FAD-dependent monooxygenase, partial [Hyphomicrobiaceae bacterium]|nr:FAD-dependent monooxygenase [Hyphomicrobiaceae bacterium]